MLQTISKGKRSGTAPVQGLSSWMWIPLRLWAEDGRKGTKEICRARIGMEKTDREKLFTLLAPELRGIK